MLVATAGERLVGCGHVRPLDAATGDLGFVSPAPDRRGGGAGRALIRFAEDLMRTRGADRARLELLVPCGSTHPPKERLRAWYERLGCAVVGRARFEDVSTQADRLTTPCEFLVFTKPLAR